MSQDDRDAGSFLSRSICRTHRGGPTKRGLGRCFVSSRGTGLLPGPFFPGRVSPSPLTDKAERGAWGRLPDGSAGLIMMFCYPSFVSLSLSHFFFLSVCVFAIIIQLIHFQILFLRPFSSQSVTMLLITREASRGRYVWHLLQHMVHSLLRAVPTSRCSTCACVRARCRALQWPSLKQESPSDTACLNKHSKARTLLG